MQQSAVKPTIDRLYTLLARRAECSLDNSRLLTRAYRAALDGEKAHRRMGLSFAGARYRLSAQTAARYFVVKWYHDPGRALDAVNLREDCLYASALRLAMPECAEECAAIADIDYSAHFPAKEG